MSSSRDEGFTLIELLIVVAIIAIIVALASVGVLRSLASAHEASAIASLRVTSSSQKAYAIACGRGAYAPSYLVLGTPPLGIGEGFVTGDLGSAVNPMKSGFRFALAAGAGNIAGLPDCNGGPTITAYYATAVPLSIVSGSRSFAVNVNGIIWQLPGGNAPAEPFGPPASIIQ